MARDNRIDTLKGLLIILVIVGHVITALDNSNVFNHAVMGLIYVFHMPLFILISGYLAKDSEHQSPRDLWRGVANIFVTLLVFQVISSIRLYYLGIGFIATFVRFPFGILWYLMSLIYWKIMLYYTPRGLLRRPALYLGLALAVSILIGLTRLGTFLSIQRALNFYFFFLLGYYYRQGMIPSRWWNNNWLHLAAAVVLLPLIMWLFPHCGNVMNGADHYGIEGIPGKVMITACSVAMSLLVFNLTRYCGWLCAIGKESLFYYLYHIFVIAMVITSLVKNYALPRTLPFILLYSAVVVGIVFVMSKIPPFKWLVAPVFKRESKKE